MGLSDCPKCGGFIPLGPDATNRCEKCGEHVLGEPFLGEAHQKDLEATHLELNLLLQSQLRQAVLLLCAWRRGICNERIHEQTKLFLESQGVHGG